MPAALTPRTYVRHPERSEWRIGQNQSPIGERITVNFEQAGKRLINAEIVELEGVNLEEL